MAADVQACMGVKARISALTHALHRTWRQRGLAAWCTGSDSREEAHGSYFHCFDPR